MTYGVTSTGFVIKPLETILDEIEADQRADIDTALNQAAHTVLGQLNAIYAAKAAEIWELAQAIYNANNPDAAVDASLDNCAALCPGISREAATKSTVTATVNLDAGVTLPANSIASVSTNTLARFETIAAVTNPAGVAADVSVAMQSESTGPVAALANTLTTIETPVTGWNSITNPADASVGSDAENNYELRLRREQTIRLAGSSHTEAIKADVLQVDGVEQCAVFENDTDAVVSGLLPHSVRVVIWDDSAADDGEVAEAIYNSKAGGVGTNGATSNTVTDNMGFTHAIKFDRATEKVLVIQLTVTTTSAPSDYQTQIKNALIYGRDFDSDGDYEMEGVSDYEIGQDAIHAKLKALAAAFSWVNDVTSFQIGWSGGALGTSNLTVDTDEIATLDSSNITFV